MITSDTGDSTMLSKEDGYCDTYRTGPCGPDGSFEDSHCAIQLIGRVAAWTEKKESP